MLKEKFKSEELNKADENIYATMEAKLAKMERQRKENGGDALVKKNGGYVIINGNELEPHEILPEAKAFHKRMREEGIDLNKIEFIPES